ncbi:MAG TPA: hypothetical protein VGG90_12800 [Candidatus Dormibacteraeota bacterium]
MPLSQTQIGRSGEALFSAIATLTADGRIELTGDFADDDHTDITARGHGGFRGLFIQIKTATHLDAAQQVEGRTTLQIGADPPEDPAFVYVFILLAGISIGTIWVVPSAEFNRLAYRHEDAQGLTLAFRAYPDRDDRYAPFRVAPEAVGPRILELMASLPDRRPPKFEGASIVARISKPA